MGRPDWRHGSLRHGPGGDGYERIECPTMIVAGWADGYRNNTFRTFEQYGARSAVALIVGPWGHNDPIGARPGPHIDLVPEMIRFFDTTCAMAARAWTREPRQVFLRAPDAPEPDLAEHRGRWVDRRHVAAAGTRPSGARRQRRRASTTLAVRGDVGTAAWISCAGDLPWGQPTDQRPTTACRSSTTGRRHAATSSSGT